MKILLLQIALFCCLCGWSTASVLMDGPVSLHSQSTLHQAPSMPASIVYEYGETIFVLRTDQFPIKVFILDGAPGANCSIPMGSMQEVFEIGDAEVVSLGGLYSVTETPETIHILIYNNEDQLKLQGYSKSNFQKAYDKDLTGSGIYYGTGLKGVDDGLLIYGSYRSNDAHLERRTHSGDLVWSVNLAFQNSINRFTDVIQFGTDFIATGFTLDRDPSSGVLYNQQIFVCRIDPANGDVSSIQYLTGDTVPNFSPFLAASASCSHFGMVYDASTEDNIFDFKLALYDGNIDLMATHDILDQPLEVEIPVGGGKGTAKIGATGILVAVGALESAYLAYFDCDDIQTAPNVTSISFQSTIIAGNINLSSLEIGAVFSIDSFVDPEIEANFIMICPE